MKQKLYDIYNFVNKKHYTTCFIVGTLILILALFSITFLPFIVKHIYKPIDNNIYRAIEFLLLFASSVLYVFSYRHFQNQLYVIIYAILYYVIFAKYYVLFI